MTRVFATVVCKVICQEDADKERNVLFVQSFCFVCCFTSQVNSYGHGRRVSSPNHTFFLGKLEQAVNQYFVHILSLVTDNNLLNDSAEGRRMTVEITS